MRHILFFEGSGVYVPGDKIWLHGADTVTWRKDKTNNPMVGVQVNNMRHAARFAQPVRVEAFDTQETRQ
jgi:hypothetical protein